MPQFEATHEWAAWACPSPKTCREDHCARCGEHCGGQGHSAAGFYYDQHWRPFWKSQGIVYSCDEDAMIVAMRARYGDEWWINEAIDKERPWFFPDRRKRRKLPIEQEAQS